MMNNQSSNQIIVNYQQCDFNSNFIKENCMNSSSKVTCMYGNDYKGASHVANTNDDNSTSGANYSRLFSSNSIINNFIQNTPGSMQSNVAKTGEKTLVLKT